MVKKTSVYLMPSSHIKVKSRPLFGKPLSWERMDNKRASRVRFVLKQGGLMEEEKWPEIQDAMIESMDKLANALRPHLSRL